MIPARLLRIERGHVYSAAWLTELMRAVLAKGKPFRFRARGFSMSPFIKDGDVVTVTPLEGRPLRPGDVVAFLHPASGLAAVHRIVRRGKGRYSTKGDNSPDTDGDLAPERILGKVSRVERDGKLVRLAVRGGAVIAPLSRSGLLAKAAGVARRAGVRRRRA